MSELKSDHLWPMLEAAKENHSPDDIGVPYFTAWAMLDDLKTLQAERDRLRAELEQAREVRDSALLQLAESVDEQGEGFIGTVDWVAPSGRTWKIDMYYESEDDQ